MLITCICNVCIHIFFGSLSSPQLPCDSLVEKKKADIVFLLDGSINFRRDSFQEVLRFASEIVDTVYEDGDSIRVGLVQYNSDPTDEFFLREYSTKRQIIDAINKVVYKGGRHANTRVGIEHLLRNHFVPDAGSRLAERVPQIAFVITGGKSVEDAQDVSLALTQKGVKVFAVGVRNIDSEEVGKIASNSATAFRVGSVQELSELSETVLETLHDAMHETLCPGVTDVSKGNCRVHSFRRPAHAESGLSAVLSCGFLRLMVALGIYSCPWCSPTHCSRRFFQDKSQSLISFIFFLPLFDSPDSLDSFIFKSISF